MNFIISSEITGIVSFATFRKRIAGACPTVEASAKSYKEDPQVCGVSHEPSESSLLPRKATCGGCAVIVSRCRNISSSSVGGSSETRSRSLDGSPLCTDCIVSADCACHCHAGASSNGNCGSFMQNCDVCFCGQLHGIRYSGRCCNRHFSQ